MADLNNQTLYSGRWYIENQVYFLQVFSDPTAEQFQSAIQTMVNAVTEVGVSCHIMLDVSQMRFTANTWMNIVNVHTGLMNVPLERISVIGQSRNRLMRLMITKLFDSIPTTLEFYDTFEDAVGSLAYS